MIYEYPKTPFTVFASHAPSHLGRQAGGRLHVGTSSVFEQSQNKKVFFDFLPKNKKRRLDIRLS